MNELVSMLMPLETLPGWPAAPEPSVVGTIGLLFGFPALAFIVVFGIAKIGTAAKARRAGGHAANAPLWLHGRQEPAGEVGGAGTAPAALEGGPTQSGEQSSTGGVSARW